MQTVDSSAGDAVHEFGGLERGTGYSVCAANTDCAVWDCVTFSTTSVSPTVAALTDCDDLGLAVGQFNRTVFSTKKKHNYVVRNTLKVTIKIASVH